ncbi:hypothetical protein SKAU_G00219600 [Synaphobranchus kaupii]|uniref:Uncharacterized protein n=1 Tax=Synaphobranchus kaupii TaxID=118154 RepID=A0A9Q1IVW8_SYNKA|nr:hypothetical protein SKAU_G00219600 [Synaphobranchus kaupii]
MPDSSVRRYSRSDLALCGRSLQMGTRRGAHVRYTRRAPPRYGMGPECGDRRPSSSRRYHTEPTEYLGASRSDNRARAVNGVSSNSQQLMNKIAAHFSHLAEPRDPHGEARRLIPGHSAPTLFNGKPGGAEPPRPTH